MIQSEPQSEVHNLLTFRRSSIRANQPRQVLSAARLFLQREAVRKFTASVGPARFFAGHKDDEQWNCEL